jgi:transketolase
VRDAFVRTLRELAGDDPRVLLMTGDLGFGVLTDFARDLPAQYLNVGVAEQNLAGIACGAALSGHVVFTYSIGNFPTLRCLEQIRNDICYHDASVKVVAIGGGFSYGALGISHHATEDIAIMRALPGMTVLCPGDVSEAVEATRRAYRTPGPCYLRLDKSAAPQSAGAGEPIEPGVPRRLRAGSDVVILGVGGVLEDALAAAETIERDGVSCGVYSVHTIKPLDTAAVTALVRAATVVATVEEHTLDGGLASVVLEACASEGIWPARLLRFAMKNEFSSVVGSQHYLRRRYGLSADALAHGIRSALSKNSTTPQLRNSQ